MPAVTTYSPSPVSDWRPYDQNHVWGTWATNNTWTAGNTLYVTPSATASNTLSWNNWIAATPIGSTQAIDVNANRWTTGTWGLWTDAYTPPLPYVVHEPTPEEIAERARHVAEMARQRAEHDREQAAADARAEALLRAHLTDEQAAEYEREHVFHVRSRSGRLYRVQRGWSGNVFEVREEQEGRRIEVASYCIHPREYVPNADNMLAQTLLLEDAETGEAEFLRIAHRTLLRHAS
jgi:hypothetical protein